MKKIFMAFCIASACAVFAHGPYGFHSRPGPWRPVHQHYHHHHSSSWFWAGFGTGVLLDAVRPVPVVGNPVWIPPVYQSRPVYDIYGRIIRYEQVLVRAGYWQY